MTCSMQHNQRRSRGTILVAAMWIVLVLTALVLVFARTTRVEIAASANHVAGLHAEAAAWAGLQFMLHSVSGTDGASIPDCGSDGQARQVGDGFFWIITPDIDADTYSFGIRDEASRLNLNTVTADMLLCIEGMSNELADSIVNWRTPDTDTATSGAGSEYYLMLADPYHCKHGPFETVEELLLVKDVTPQLLYGAAYSRNPYFQDDTETTLSIGYGLPEHGVFDYFTVHSRELNQSTSGDDRLDVNNNETQALSDLLRDVLTPSRLTLVMDRVRSQRPFDNIFDFHFKVSLTADEFAQIADKITVGNERVLRGPVNINTAPREVLLCLPGLDEADVSTLMSHRSSTTNGIAWVVEVLPREKAVPLGGLITSRSYQFSAEIAAVCGSGRAFRRYRAIVDASAGPPRVLQWKNLTHLGWPLNDEILSDLRATATDTAMGGLR